MKTNRWNKIVMGPLAGLWLMMAGCGVGVRAPAGGVVYASAPPPVTAEVDIQTASPGPDYVWVGGAWAWGPERRWNWERGHWDRPPHPGAHWEPHRYTYR